MEETMTDVQSAETTATDSSPEEQITVESTEPVASEETMETESQLDTKPEDSAEGDVSVPLHENPRFKEVYSEMKTYKEEVEALKAKLEGLSATSQETSQSGDEIPDHLWKQNADGEWEVDTPAYIDWKIQNGVTSILRQKETETKVWNETYEAYPQLKEDPELKSIVENGAFAEFQRTGKAVHPKDYAKRLFDRFAEKKKEGARIAQENTKVIDSAYLEPNSPASNRERTLTNADLAKASPEQIQKWEESGELDIALRAGTLKGTPIA